ncbi:transcriptional accessory protein [Phytophthora cinnamomi]|uniref:transcriptional accessory protein n=1 Tax=Phytophthora cinnamomi TaxID=4785 RepID=UPI003559EAA8|nr:transcriptional accessory protein [Phytophthora cinnamomi]
MSAQATRLESLFLLVRDGSSAQIRENAAEKLGEVAVRSPEACASILQQLRPLVVDADWDIRVAASRCLHVVARALRHERENVADLFALVSLGSAEASCTALNLQTVDINAVVREGAPLLRSGGEEYQYATNLTEEERRVHAVKQRRLLLRRLSGAGGQIWKTREDSLTKQLLPRLNQDHAKEIADDIEASEAQPGKRLYSLASSTESETAATSRPQKFDTKELTNVLTNLQLLRKICVHPALVTNDAIIRELNAKEKKDLRDWKSSGKMTGLRDLLVECCDIATGDQGSRQDPAADVDSFDDSNLSPHRCLVFAHLQKTLDLIEQMLRDALPGVTYRRLDGQTPHAKRAGIVQCFNADPSIDVLLLTTSVGGLGLTLTGADTVIFIEHSWNPFVDLQAMDRAHRIGQKRTVRVFRLIMEESLEEHILNLQEFKEQVAATVVRKSDAQTSMNTNTKGVLNLLQASSSAVAAKELRVSVAAKKAGGDDHKIAAALPQEAQELLDQIGELWNESQYDSLAFPESTDD